MDPEAAAVVTPHLLVSEKLLWCGRPHVTTALFRWRAVMIVLMGIPALVMLSFSLDYHAASWVGLAGAEPSLVERADANSILLAVLVGFLIAEAIVFRTYLSNTFYGVTNQRVIIVSGFRELEMAAVLLDLLNIPRLSVRRFRHSVELLPTYGGPWGALPFTNPSVPPDWTGGDWCRLLALEDAHRVYDLIIESANKLK